MIAHITELPKFCQVIKGQCRSCTLPNELQGLRIIKN